MPGREKRNRAAVKRERFLKFKLGGVNFTYPQIEKPDRLVGGQDLAMFFGVIQVGMRYAAHLDRTFGIQPERGAVYFDAFLVMEHGILIYDEIRRYLTEVLFNKLYWRNNFDLRKPNLL